MNFVVYYITRGYIAFLEDFLRYRYIYNIRRNLQAHTLAETALYGSLPFYAYILSIVLGRG